MLYWPVWLLAQCRVSLLLKMHPGRKSVIAKIARALRTPIADVIQIKAVIALPELLVTREISSMSVNPGNRRRLSLTLFLNLF